MATFFFQATRGLAERAGLTSKDHITVDGTLIEAWASMKSFRPKDDQDQDPHALRRVYLETMGHLFILYVLILLLHENWLGGTYSGFRT